MEICYMIILPQKYIFSDWFNKRSRGITYRCDPIDIPRRYPHIFDDFWMAPPNYYIGVVKTTEYLWYTVDHRIAYEKLEYELRWKDNWTYIGHKIIPCFPNYKFTRKCSCMSPWAIDMLRKIDKFEAASKNVKLMING